MKFAKGGDDFIYMPKEKWNMRKQNSSNTSKKVLVFVLSVLSLFSYFGLRSAGGGSPDGGDSSKSSSSEAAALFEEALQAMKGNDLKRAKQIFEDLIFNHPASEVTADYYMHLGEIYQKEGLLYEAAAIYKQLITKYPDYPMLFEAFSRQGEIAFQLGDMRKAQGIFKQLLLQYPQTELAKRASFRLGDCFYDSGDITTARLYYYEGMEKLPEYLHEYPHTAFNVGSLYMQDNYFDRALKVFLDLERDYPDDQMAHKAVTFCGDMYYEQGKFAEAVRAYQRVINNYPESIGAQVSQIRMADLGLEHPEISSEISINDPNFPVPTFHDPISAYRQLIQRKDIDQDLAHLAEYKLSLALQKKKKHQEAIATFQSLLAKAPDERIDRNILYALKQELVNLLNKNFQEKAFLSVIRIYEENQGILEPFLQEEKWQAPYLNLAQSYQALDFYQPALRFYKKAQKIGDKTPGQDHINDQIQFNLGYLFFQMKEHQTAREALEKVSPKSLFSFEALSLIGDIYREKKEYGRAIEHYLAASKTRSPQGGAALLIKVGRCYQTLGQTPQAIHYFSEAADMAQKEKKPQYLIDSYLALADCQYRNQNYDQARETYQKLQNLPLDPDNRDWVLFQMGNCSLKKAEPKTALNSFEKLKAANPDPIWPIIVNYKESEIELP